MSPLKPLVLLTTLLVLASLTVGTYAFSHYRHAKGALTQKPPHESSPSAFPTTPSRVAVSARIPFSEITQMIHEKVPAQFSGGGHGPDAGRVRIPPFGPTITVGTKYDYQVRRGVPTLTRLNDHTARFSVPISFSGHGGLRGDGARLLSLDRKSFRGELLAHLDVEPQLQPDWKLNSRVSVSYQWIHDPKVEIVGGIWINIKKHIEDPLDKAMQDVSAKVTALINQQDVRSKVAEAYVQKSYPVDLPTVGSAFVNVLPQGVEFSGVTFTSDALSVSVAVIAQVEVGTQPLPEQALPLPNLSPISAAPNQLDIKIPIHVPYATLQQALNAQLTNHSFHQSVKVGQGQQEAQITLKGFEVYPSGQHLVLGIEIEADLPSRWFDTRGFVYLTGTPVIQDGVLHIQDLHYTQALDHELWTAAGILFQESIAQALRDNSTYDTRQELARVKEQIAEALKEKPLTQGLSLIIENPDIQIGRLATGEKEITLEALFQATAHIRARSSGSP
ncbi:protein of unknown function [Prosthecobacter debontii]|uniref:DUF4403 family protein n=1 Tax=Prosthecobacter debontii TaxID=48467 RepID=A0A1T4Z1M3_9BACT|nr:DUF4403 family protein [Prosthecobacter debontii]SKB07947.1 protein of unknown function [Prosthecobacter debontii]